MSEGYKLTGFGCVEMCGNPNCDHVPRWDFRTRADTPTATDREARAMLAALEARLDAALARIDALEAGRAGEPVVCECGHYHGAHYKDGACQCDVPGDHGRNKPCQCQAWRPVPQVTP